MRVRTILGAGVAAALAAGGLALLLRTWQALPEGPVEPAWDREACAACRMHVGEPAFAAQLQLADGRVLFFDDPGCLLVHLDREPWPIHATWVRHVREERWIRLEHAGFVPVDRSPMGFALGAVDAREAGALTPDQARERARLVAGRGEARS